MHLLFGASISVNNRERDDISEPVLIDIDKRKTTLLSSILESNRTEKDEEFGTTIEIPDVYSFTRSEDWPTVSFRTNPVRTKGLEDRETLSLAPR